MGNSGQIRSEAMSAVTELLEVNSWRMVRSTSSLQIPCCGVLSAGPSFERETVGSGNNEHEPLYSGVFQCFVDGCNSV
jgi:hypothetical protein